MELNLIIAFMAGIILTLCTLVVFVLFLAGKPEVVQVSKKKELSKADREMIGSIKYRLKNIESITIKQLKLMDMIQAPNKGSAHARGKRDLMGSIEDLEKEKMDIFRSILKDGFDPTVSVCDETGYKVEMKMSAAITKSEKHNKTEDNVPLPPNPFRDRTRLTPPIPIKTKLRKTDLKKPCDNVFNLSDYRSKNESGPTKTH